MYKYYVIENKLLTGSVRLITLEIDDDSKPLLFEPGQYAAISLHDKVRPTANRCFSITSASNDKKTLQFSIRIGGKFTSALERLKLGDEVDVRGPFGGFVFKPHAQKNIVMLAGGIGVAPFMSMIRYATELKLDNKIHLIYSVRDQKDIPFVEEISQLNLDNQNLIVTYFVGEGEVDRLPTHRVLIGRMDLKSLNQLKIDMPKQTFMICGPPPYMNAMYKLLKTSGTPKNKILSEAFSQNHKKQTGKLRDWPFNMYAMAGFSMLIIAFFVIANDLFATLPKIDANNILTPSATNDLIKAGSGSVYDRVNSVPPTIDTNITPVAVVVPQPLPVRVAPGSVVSPVLAPVCKGSGC